MNTDYKQPQKNQQYKTIQNTLYNKYNPKTQKTTSYTYTTSKWHPPKKNKKHIEPLQKW